MTKSSRDRNGTWSLLRQIKVVCFDFDGVFTDNRVLVSEEGRESVWCYRSDGIGLARLQSVGVQCVVISREKNPVVRMRMKKLGVECHTGATHKKYLLERVLKKRGMQPADAAFVGNDLPDLECLKFVGIGIAVSDAYPEVAKAARLITARPGGYGAVREVCDWIVEAYQSLPART